jgi:diaminohydroxyphosphoribosylaminopyrimidine deaminase/5-amino-6-(5-phosphoribosylamino)uracil reductase
MNDEDLMRRCLQLARLGLGHTRSNPLVGAVLVGPSGELLSEGHHRIWGGPHAEVHALEGMHDRALLQGSTLYVNLEPCAHHGKTPPCADLIAARGVGRVVVAMEDPNPLVAGKGMARLRAAGVRTQTGVLQEEARFLNRRFLTFHEKNRPYILLKWAQSPDGRMGLEGQGQVAISEAHVKPWVHRWRGQEMAILVGANTALMDNPHLDARILPGPMPVRVVLDPNRRVKGDLNLLKGNQPTLIFGGQRESREGNVHILPLQNPTQPWNEVFGYLHGSGIVSVMVEGGAFTLRTLIEVGLWDEARILTGNVPLGGSVLAPEMPFPSRMVELAPETSMRIAFPSQSFIDLISRP